MNLLWGAFSGIILTAPSGIILGILLAGFYFWAENSEIEFWIGVIAYLLLIVVAFFLVGLLRGRVTGRGEDGATTAIIACLIQGLIALCLQEVLGLVLKLWYITDPYGFVYVLFEIGWLFLFQLPFSLLDGYIGGSIGSRFLYQRSKPDGVKRG